MERDFASFIETTLARIILMRCQRPKLHAAPENKASFGNIMISCLIVSHQAVGGIFRRWRKNWDCNRDSLKPVCTRTAFEPQLPRTYRMGSNWASRVPPPF